MKFYASGADLAKDMGIDGQVLVDIHNAHHEAAKKQEADPEGGKWPAYPSGKTHDEASGKTGSGKKFYHNVLSGSDVLAEPFYVAIITPVIHYCMGGLEIDVNSSVIAGDGKPIPGLYCAGEVSGGVHGNNRLGGNSLLDCVVFGRVAGKHCAKYMLGDEFHPVDLKALIPKDSEKKKQDTKKEEPAKKEEGKPAAKIADLHSWPLEHFDRAAKGPLAPLLELIPDPKNWTCVKKPGPERNKVGFVLGGSSMIVAGCLMVHAPLYPFVGIAMVITKIQA
jgi:succinate dehydrogenase/fumarate reductase flavoprotein subunit